MSKTKLVLFFGGRSAEHEVSVVSARNIARALSAEKFELSFVGIRDNGDWVLLKKPLIPDALKRVEELPAADVDPVSLGCEGGRPHLFFTRGAEKRPVDVAFPVLHGTYGEDGSIQGLFRVMRLPFVGCGVTASAVGMDKDFLKRLLNEAGIPNAPSVLITAKSNPGFDELERRLGLPFFIKPANAGSSVGVHKIKSRADFERGLTDAFQYDRKILAEKFMQGREIEISAFGPTEDCRVSLPGEVITRHEFYSYESKYLDPDGAAFKIPVELKAEELATLQRLARETYRVLGCEGMARVDFFMTGPNEFHVNEINTLPGFTAISMYPKMWEASGWAYGDLIQALIDDALAKAKAEDALKTQFPRG